MGARSAQRLGAFCLLCLHLQRGPPPPAVRCWMWWCGCGSSLLCTLFAPFPACSLRPTDRRRAHDARCAVQWGAGRGGLGGVPAEALLCRTRTPTRAWGRCSALVVAVQTSAHGGKDGGKAPVGRGLCREKQAAQLWHSVVSPTLCCLPCPPPPHLPSPQVRTKNFEAAATCYRKAGNVSRAAACQAQAMLQEAAQVGAGRRGCRVAAGQRPTGRDEWQMRSATCLPACRVLTSMHHSWRAAAPCQLPATCHAHLTPHSHSVPAAVPEQADEDAAAAGTTADVQRALRFDAGYTLLATAVNASPQVPGATGGCRRCCGTT